MFRRLIIVAAFAILVGLGFQPRRVERVDAQGKVLLGKESLSRPTYPFAVEAINYGLCRVMDSLGWWPLDKESLFATASSRNGGLIEYFADRKYWEEGLDALLYSLTHEAGLSCLGRFFMRENLLTLLSAQLQAVALVKIHPEITQTELPPPLVLAGLPRTGTTALQSLLCVHHDITCLPYFEALNPVSAYSWIVSDRIGTLLDPRVWQSHLAIGAIHLLRPWLPVIHRMDTFLPFEEIQLNAVSFGSTLFEAAIPGIPTYSEWYKKTDHEPSYRSTKLLLQVIDFQHGKQAAESKPRYRLLKSPQHSEQVTTILKVFPGAKFLMTRRPSIDLVASLLVLVTYSAGMLSDRIDVQAYGTFWLHRLQRMLQRYLAQVRDLSSNRFLEVAFENFAANNTRVLVEVLRWAGLDDGPLVLKTLQEHARANPREGAKRIRYDLSQFGIQVGSVKEMFRFYDEAS